MIILDTGVLIELERNNPAIIKSLTGIKDEHPDVCITGAVYAEFLYGYARIRKKMPVLPFDVLVFDARCADIFAREKLRLEQNGSALPLFDLITASCALSHKATIVTTDSHFTRVAGLKVILLAQ